MKGKEGITQGFQFVSVVPSATDDASKAERRRLFRSNAANYQWTRQKRRLQTSSPKSREELSPISANGALRITSELPTEVDDDVQITGRNFEIGTLTPVSRNGQYSVSLPSLSLYMSLISKGQIGPLMKFSQFPYADQQGPLIPPQEKKCFQADPARHQISST
jgi:hypothetical protein